MGSRGRGEVLVRGQLVLAGVRWGSDTGWIIFWHLAMDLPSLCAGCCIESRPSFYAAAAAKGSHRAWAS